MKKLFGIFLFTFYFICVSAQETKQTPDSLKFYKKIEKAAKKRGATYWLYKEIFNLPDSSKKKEKQRKEVSYQSLKGKIIRNIEIETFDPFGYSVQDTSVHPTSFIQRGGNFLHQKSVKLAIRNQLLYSEGDSLDPLKIKESERILRQSSQVREVLTTVRIVKNSKDSVDVFIREQDYWTKGFGVSIGDGHFSFNFSDHNFLGLNHFVSNDITYNKLTDKYDVLGTYAVPYIGRTLIVPTIYYNSNPDNFYRGVEVNRPFISSLTKWAGSAALFDTKASASEINPEGDTLKYATRYFSKDFWLGRSFPLINDTSEEIRSTRIIISGRYAQSDFFYHPPEMVAPSFLYENTQLYLLSAGLSNRTYYRDYYVYRYGTQEDVPAGRLLQLTGGYENRKSGDRLYAGLSAASANHFDNLGYISLRMGIGSFIHSGKLEQSVFRMGVGYFSDLLEMKKTKIRQFMKLDVIYGFNRIESEHLNLNGAIKGFQSDELTGVKKAVLSLQTQMYLPYQFLGFRFAPFFFISAGLIAEEGRPFTRSKLYQGYGFGLLVKNELLVINTFQLSIGIYPFVPGNESAVLRFNPIKSYDFSFEDFVFQKPAIIPFN